jgi:putative membrane protein
MMWFGNRGEFWQDMPCLGNWSGFGGGRIFMMLGGIILLAVLIAAIVLMVKLIGRSQTAAAGQGFTGGQYQNNIAVEETALNILNNRFARGEIDENEYERRKKLILSK